MIKEFMRSHSIFTPPHVKKMMDDGDDIYKLHGNTFKDVIQSNDDSRDHDSKGYVDQWQELDIHAYCCKLCMPPWFSHESISCKSCLILW